MTNRKDEVDVGLDIAGIDTWKGGGRWRSS